MPNEFFRVVFKDSDEKWKVKKFETASQAAEFIAAQPGSAQIRYAVHSSGSNIPFETREAAEAFVKNNQGQDLNVSHRQPLANLPSEALALYYQN